jgi:hypothetical protein
MFSRNYILGLSVLFILFHGAVYSQHTKHTLTRKESFFGLHFDFHASSADSLIGNTLTEEMVDSLLRAVKPDFIQVDCKGHPGFSSYPTKAGIQAPRIAKDPLRIFRKVTAAHQVALYVHYSGVYDVQAVRQNPRWAVIQADGKTDPEKTSVHGDYVHKLMIPQLKELSKEYNLNGIWVDGDCWATKPDYSEASLRKFNMTTGISTIPYNADDPCYFDFMEFSRKSFLDYVRTYVDSLHRFNPSFQVASNWAFSSFMPLPVSVDVDFLSGDLSPNNSVYNAAFEARCLASQGNMYRKPWDIMSWSFTLNWDRTGVHAQKSIVQLTQEAAEIMAMGGGFQCYFQQNHDASIKPWQIPTMKGLSEFIRPRQPYCQYSEPIHQIALLYSNEAHKRSSKAVFSNDGLDGLKGILNALLDGQQAVEVVMEHHLHQAMDKYPMIVIPEWRYLQPEFRSELLDYARRGGNLLIIGPEAVQLFEKELGIKVTGKPMLNTSQFLAFDHAMTAMPGLMLPVTLSNNTIGFGSIYKNDDFRDPSVPAASISTYGRGKIAAVFLNLGENYAMNKSSLERDFVNHLANTLLQNPIVKVKGSHLVHVALNKLGKSTIIHLMNSGGQHADKNVYAYDEVPPIGALTVTLDLPKPKHVVLQPDNKPLAYTYKNGKIMITIPSLDIHRMVVVD